MKEEGVSKRLTTRFARLIDPTSRLKTGLSNVVMEADESLLKKRVMWASAPWLVFYGWALLFSGSDGLILYLNGLTPYINPNFQPFAPERTIFILGIVTTVFLVYVQHSVPDRSKAFMEVYEAGAVLCLSVSLFTDLLPLVYPGLEWGFISEGLFQPPYLVIRIIPDIVVFTVIAFILYRKKMNIPVLVMILMNLVQFIFPPLGFPFFWFGVSPDPAGGLATARIVAMVFSFGIYKFWGDFLLKRASQKPAD
jgi:hypothetical protein